MKTTLIILVSILVGLTSANALGHKSIHPKKNNYIVITSNIQQINPIVLAAKDLAKEDGKNFGEFQIIICGKAVAELIQPEMIAPFLEMTKKEGVKLVACGYSLNQSKINPKDLPNAIKVVDNGLLYDFQLQKKGYLSIEL